MPKVQVVPVRTPEQREAFLRLPWKIYRDDPYWVPPLLSEERKHLSPRHNPFFQHAEVELFLALRDGEPVGRIEAHIDHNYNEFHDERTGQFGFFESVPDREVAHALFDTVVEWHRQRGMETLLGPLSFSTNDIAGLLVEGFQMPPVFLMAYNPPYYPELLESYGFQKAKDLLAYRIDLDDAFWSRTHRILQRLEPLMKRAAEQGFTIRNINLRDFRNEVRRIMAIYNDAWSANWGFVPLTDAEIYQIATDLKRVVIPDLAKIVEHHGTPVAFAVVLPDFNQAIKPLNGRLFPFGILKFLWHRRKIDGLRVFTLGIRRGYRKRGVDSMLYYHLVKSGEKYRDRYRWVEVSWLLEDNYLILRATEFMGGYLYKRYRVYRLNL